MRPFLTSTLLAVALLALAAPGASSTAGKKVASGDYQAAPVIDADETYSVGLFSVEKVKGKRRIVRTEGYLGIYYPDDGVCDDFDLPLAAESIPIASSGRFKFKERTPIEDTSVEVSWKGRWTKPGVVVGSITIKHDGCVSTRKWTGGKVE